MRTKHGITAIAFAVLLSTSLVRCDCSDAGIGEGAPCRNASECQSDLVCAPLTHTCAIAEDTPCTRNIDCGLGAICESEGTCVQNTPGGPCMTTENCVTGEHCAASICSPPGDEGAACLHAVDCRSDLICDPATSTCKASPMCSTNDQCGAGAVCNASGMCEQNMVGGPCMTSRQCVIGQSCVGGTCVDGCGGDLYSAEDVPPNLLVIVDRSSSMLQEIGGQPKWDIARNASYNLLTTYRGRIQFGLSLFPGIDQSCNQGMRCGPNAVQVPIAPMNEDPISTYLMAADTCNLGTPIAEALMVALGYSGLEDTTRANYVVLLTDGMANCEDPVPQVTALRMKTPEVKTFVVGFGGEVDPNQLAAMAAAGGTALPGTPSYYQADDAASLRTAFASIAGRVLSCSYELSARPPDPNLLYIYFDGAEIRRDMSHASGWDYETGSNQLTFYGASCDSLQAGQVGQLIVVYGCPLTGLPDAGVRDSGIPDPAGDGGPVGCLGCGDCPMQACLIPSGQTVGTCGPCGNDFDCCLGRICRSGQCVPDL